MDIHTICFLIYAAFFAIEAIYGWKTDIDFIQFIRPTVHCSQKTHKCTSEEIMNLNFDNLNSARVVVIAKKRKMFFIKKFYSIHSHIKNSNKINSCLVIAGTIDYKDSGNTTEAFIKGKILFTFTLFPLFLLFLIGFSIYRVIGPIGNTFTSIMLSFLIIFPFAALIITWLGYVMELEMKEFKIAIDEIGRIIEPVSMNEVNEELVEPLA